MSKHSEELQQNVAEISKQIDRRLTRSGWAIMLGVVCVLFLIIYLFITFFQVPGAKRANQVLNLEQRVEQLEQQVKSLEQQIKQTAE